jgi:hypothetical protein
MRLRAPALLLALAVTLLLAALRPRTAAAIPPFARKYGAPCGLCHAPAYPALNAVGRQFQERGYQLPPEVEAPARAAQVVVPDPEQRLALLNQAPLALRAQSAAAFAPDPGGAGENAVDLRPFQALYLVAGASLYPDVSLFAAATLAPAAGLHHAALGFHDLFGTPALNLRVGRFLLLDYARPEHRFLTAFGNPIATTAVGYNPTVLDSTQHGVALQGRLLGRRLFYNLALVQGAQGPDGVRDLDGHKDLFAQLQGTPHHRLTLGLLGYRGRTQITDQAGGVGVRFTDRFHILGADAELEAGVANLFAQGLYAQHDNPYGNDEHADHWGFRLEARAALSPRWFLVARYDQLSSHHLTPLRRATVHLGWLVLGNLRLAAESAVDLVRVEGSTAALLLEVAL